MPGRQRKLTVGKILKEVFSIHGIKTRKDPALIQWTVQEYGTSKRRIDTLDALITSLTDGNYHIELERVSIKLPEYSRFRVNFMDIEATLKDGKWSDVRAYTEEEELPSKKYATPPSLIRRMNDVEDSVYKILMLMMLIWEAVKFGKGFFSG